MIKNFLRTTLRNLTRNAATSSLNILGLAVGMTAAILIFLWVDNQMTFDSSHPEKDRIYRLTTHYTSSNWVWPVSSFAPCPTPAHRGARGNRGNQHQDRV